MILTSFINGKMLGKIQILMSIYRITQMILKELIKQAFLYFLSKKIDFAKNEQKTIRLSNMDISPYPNSFGKIMFKISMDEDYQSPTVKFVGKKRTIY